MTWYKHDNESKNFTSPAAIPNRQNRFSGREVGLTHPDTDAFIRLTDDGGVEIVGGPGLSVLMGPRGINFVADTVRFVCKDLRWNDLMFNEQADSFQEPAFIDADENTTDLYAGVSYFTDGDDVEA